MSDKERLILRAGAVLKNPSNEHFVSELHEHVYKCQNASEHDGTVTPLLWECARDIHSAAMSLHFLGEDLERLARE